MSILSLEMSFEQDQLEHLDASAASKEIRLVRKESSSPKEAAPSLLHLHFVGSFLVLVLVLVLVLLLVILLLSDYY